MYIIYTFKHHYLFKGKNEEKLLIIPWTAALSRVSPRAITHKCFIFEALPLLFAIKRHELWLFLSSTIHWPDLWWRSGDHRKTSASSVTLAKLAVSGVAPNQVLPWIISQYTALCSIRLYCVAICFTSVLTKLLSWLWLAPVCYLLSSVHVRTTIM